MWTGFTIRRVIWRSKSTGKLTAKNSFPSWSDSSTCPAGKFWPSKKRRSAKGTPVFTEGQYTTRGWTEWTQGFQFGSAVLQFDATGDERFLKIGRRGTVKHMASHVSHIGVHDHGFNNVSPTVIYAALCEGKIAADPREMEFYELALKVSGAVQAARWTTFRRWLHLLVQRSALAVH